MKPLRLVRVTVELADEPAVIARFAGEAEMAKSGAAEVPTVTYTVTAWDNDPLIPVTVAEYFPLLGAVTVRVAVPEPTTLAGISETASP